MGSLQDMQTFGGELAKEARELINLQRAAELEISHPTDGEPVVKHILPPVRSFNQQLGALSQQEYD